MGRNVKFMNPVQGVIVAMDTPFADDGSVSTERVQLLCDFLLNRGVQGLFICGGTGQAGVLSINERMQVTACVLRHIRQCIPVLVHVGAPVTADSLALAIHAAENGAAGIVASAPNWYYNHEYEAVLDYFRLIYNSTGLPFYLYRRSGDSWSADTVRILRKDCPQLVGVKDSSNNIKLHLEFLRIDDFVVYQGYEPLATASLLAGGKGLVSGLATVFPEAVVKLYETIRNGDAKAIQAQQRMINRLVQITYLPSPYRRFKAVLAARGCPVGEVRRPFRPIDQAEKTSLLEELQALDVL